MKRLFAAGLAMALAACTVRGSGGERLFACEADGGCPEGYVCHSAEGGLCVRDGEFCLNGEELPTDGGEQIDVEVSGNLKWHAQDQRDVPFCPAQKGPDVFYNFNGSGPFTAELVHDGGWSPVLLLQKCGGSDSQATCVTGTSISNPKLDPGFWKVVVSSTGGAGPYTLKLKGRPMVRADYCSIPQRLDTPVRTDGGRGTGSLDTRGLVPWPQNYWTSCSAAPSNIGKDGVVRIDAPIAGQLVVTTTSPFKHWAQLKLPQGGDTCPSVASGPCREATDAGATAGYRSVVSGRAEAGENWLWLGSTNDGGVYDVSVEWRP